MKFVLFLFLTFCCLLDAKQNYKELPKFSPSQVDFYIITLLPEGQSSPDGKIYQEQLTSYDDEYTFDSKDFNKDLETIVLIHGFRTNKQEFADNFVNSYYSVGRKVNIIAIDWYPMANVWNYFLAAKHTKRVGAVIADFLSASIKKGKLNKHKIQVIGHSLGAHVAGFMGKKLAEYDIRVELITALDPAKLAFSKKKPHLRLSDNDAKWVEVIHTDAGFLGIYKAIGRADFYLNGGREQSHYCSYFAILCPHSYANKWYRETLEADRIYGYIFETRDEMELAIKNKKLLPQPRGFFGSNPQPRPDKRVVYIPYDKVTVDNTSKKTQSAPVHHRPKRENTARVLPFRGDEVIVIFGLGEINPRNLFFLLNENHQDLIVEYAVENQAYFINSNRVGWKSSSKYYICAKTEPSQILNYIDGLKAPFRMVLAFDYTDLYREDFWQLVVTLVRVCHHNKKIVSVAMNMDDEEAPMSDLLDELKEIFQGAFHVSSRYGITHDAINKIEMQKMAAIRFTGPLIDQGYFQTDIDAIKDILENN